MHEESMTVNVVPPQSPRVRKPAAQIMREVAEAYRVTVADMKGPSRNRWLVKARCEAMRKVAAEWQWLSYPILGRLFGRDYTTVMYHVVKDGDRNKRKHCTCDRQHGNTHKPLKGGAQ